MVAPEYGFLHVYAPGKCQRLAQIKGQIFTDNYPGKQTNVWYNREQCCNQGERIKFMIASLDVPFKMF